MHNIIKIHAWAEPYVNFLLGETFPLVKCLKLPYEIMKN